MNVKTYSKKKDGNKNITPNIKIKELACHDGTDLIKEDLVVVCLAQYVRDVFNKPIIITSAYRTPYWNAHEGGTSESKHLISCALDVRMNGIQPQTIGNLVYSYGLNRVGVYTNFTHFDTDRSPQWLSQGKFSKVNVPYMNRLISSKVNKTDYLVAIIQYKLNLLGYNCGTEDGIAGRKFDAAVKQFQRNNGLIVDGAVGIMTWNKLYN